MVFKSQLAYLLRNPAANFENKPRRFLRRGLGIHDWNLTSGISLTRKIHAFGLDLPKSSRSKVSMKSVNADIRRNSSSFTSGGLGSA
jgi:hypothetical protein